MAARHARQGGRHAVYRGGRHVRTWDDVIQDLVRAWAWIEVPR